MSLYLSNFYMMIITFMMYKNSSVLFYVRQKFIFKSSPCVCRKYFWVYTCLKFHTEMWSLDGHHILTVKVSLFVFIRKEYCKKLAGSCTCAFRYDTAWLLSLVRVQLLIE